MKNFIVDARKIKCAMHTMASNDIRYYLNGLLIGGGKIVSTDGHRMTIVDCDEAKFEPIIVSIKGKLLSSSTEAEFVFIGDDHGVVMTKNRAGQAQDKVVKFSVVEGRFPDYNRVVPDGDSKPVKEIGFNLKYLADIDKAASDLGSQFELGKFQFFDQKGVIEINTPENKAKIIIMSARL